MNDVQKHTRSPAVTWNSFRAVLCYVLILGAFVAIVLVDMNVEEKKEEWKQEFFKANPNLINPDDRDETDSSKATE